MIVNFTSSSPHLQNPFSHPFHQVPTDSQTQHQHSEDDESRSSDGGPTSALKPKHDVDGALIEVVWWPRGHLPDSKNKPMSPYILEVPGGNDVVEAISKFCHRKNTNLCVLTASRTVANVTLRQLSTTLGTTVTFHSRFDMLSVSATFLTTSFPPIPNGFTISLSGPQGQIVEGLIAEALIAARTVYIVATSFNNPKSSLVHATFSVSQVYYARLSIAYVAFFLFF
ncbi:AT-hook motif nuclear-localized protein 17-like [Quercus lobata]|uniref:AT-hook motif nuclear-localized protein 17-like n=1 Tax=Quercus lobata TaxID=97700 RepID=UPI001244F754|nr:AT-hook motif nuclear-localized protein 17-like [Quercus lobata]